MTTTLTEMLQLSMKSAGTYHYHTNLRSLLTLAGHLDSSRRNFKWFDIYWILQTSLNSLRHRNFDSRFPRSPFVSSTEELSALY